MATTNTDNIPKLITLTHDKVTALLDDYRSRNPNVSRFGTPDSVRQLRLLHEALEKLECAATKAKDIINSLDKATELQVKTTLNECGSLASTLRVRFEKHTFDQEPIHTIRQLEELVGAVNLARDSIFADGHDDEEQDYQDENTTQSYAGEPSANHVRYQSSDGSTVRLLDRLNQLEHENTDLRSENVGLKRELASIRAIDSAKLGHIHEIHEAVRTLNRLCPPLPEQPSWESLSADLHTVLKDINDVHKILELHRSEKKQHHNTSNPAQRSRSKTSPSSTPLASSTISAASAATASAMRSPSKPNPIPRPPSPTDSNVSSIRSSTTTTNHTRRKSHANASSKRNSGGGGGGGGSGTSLPFRINN